MFSLQENVFDIIKKHFLKEVDFLKDPDDPSSNPRGVGNASHTYKCKTGDCLATPRVAVNLLSIIGSKNSSYY